VQVYIDRVYLLENILSLIHTAATALSKHIRPLSRFPDRLHKCLYVYKDCALARFFILEHALRADSIGVPGDNT
jgi:hypothetical protein